MIGVSSSLGSQEAEISGGTAEIYPFKTGPPRSIPVHEALPVKMSATSEKYGQVDLLMRPDSQGIT